MKRATRRGQKERAKARARGRLVRQWACTFATFPITDRDVGVRARTPQLCSCDGCGNRRANAGPTLQERRSALSARRQEYGL